MEHNRENKATEKYAKDFDLCLLGLTIVIGGQYFGWNAGLSMGFGEYLIGLTLIFIGYTCLVLCISELSSCVPFGGGSYAYVRLTVGNCAGFVVGSLECLECVMYVSASVLFMGQMITSLTNIDHHFEPLWWFIIYSLAVSICVCGGKAFWRVNFVLAVISLLIIVIYILGCLPYVNLPKYAYLNESSSKRMNGGMASFLSNLPFVMWWFIGVECINAATNDALEPKKSVPRGYVSCMTILSVTAFCTYLCAISMPPGIEKLSFSPSPLNHGFKVMFGDQFSWVGTCLSLPATFATILGFVYAYGRRIRSMGESMLFPKVLGTSVLGYNTADVALLAGSVAGYAVCVALKYNTSKLSPDAFQICVLASCLTYCANFTCYIIFKSQYARFQREFKSPLGHYGAILGIFVFAMVFVGSAFFQNDSYQSLQWFLLICVIFAFYYYCSASRYEYFSSEEQEVLFAMYTSMHNAKKSSAKKLRRKQPCNYLLKMLGLKKIFYSPDSETSKSGEGSISIHVSKSARGLRSFVGRVYGNVNSVSKVLPSDSTKNRDNHDASDGKVEMDGNF